MTKSRFLKFCECNLIDFEPDVAKEYRLSYQQIIDHEKQGLQDRSIHDYWNSKIDFSDLLEYRTSGKTYARSKSSCLVFNSIVIDLILSAQDDSSVCYSRNNNYYSKLSNGLLGRSSVLQAVDYLVQKGLVHNFIAPACSHGKQESFLHPTPLVLKMFGHISVADLFSENVGESAITLKERQSQKHIKVPATRLFERAQKEMSANNSYLASLDIGFSGKIIQQSGSLIKYEDHLGEPKTINLLVRKQTRQFLRPTDSSGRFPISGGRMYGGHWQQMNKNDRCNLTINGESVKEKDYQCIGLKIAYAMKGRIYKDDGYQIDLKGLSIGDLKETLCLEPSVQREIVKKAVNISMNARTRGAATGAIAKALKEICPRKVKAFSDKDISTYAGKIIDELISHHPLISSCFFSDFGVVSQYADSEIMTELHKIFRLKEIPVLSLHDSVLYPISKSKEINEIFDEVLTKHMISLTNFIDTDITL